MPFLPIDCCDHYSRLDYLLGCYFGRFWAIAQTHPEVVLRDFAFRYPDRVAETLEQLTALLIEVQSENEARAFLEAVDCPYYPPFYGRGSREWLKQVRLLLLSEHLGLPGEIARTMDDIPALGDWQALGDFDPVSIPELPLLLPDVFLRGYYQLNAPGQLEMHLELLEPHENLADYASRLSAVVMLSNPIVPLREVRP